ncbi:hypothetical protein MUP79_01295, partial [Candidatus Bathyarchaeota archaeon]|nr:hypothetical protein [Candidatus Bathyarchaeota archaeon]
VLPLRHNVRVNAIKAFHVPVPCEFRPADGFIEEHTCIKGFLVLWVPFFLGGQEHSERHYDRRRQKPYD